MWTATDERKGLVKTDWPSVRERVKKVNPEFTKIVDELNSSKKFSYLSCVFSIRSIKRRY